MSEQRFTLEQWSKDSLYYSDGEYSAHMGISFICKKVEKKLNEQQATIEHLKKRLYDFEKRKIIEESEIDEDVIPKVKLLRTELFGEKYE